MFSGATKNLRRRFRNHYQMTSRTWLKKIEKKPSNWTMKPRQITKPQKREIQKQKTTPLEVT